MAHIYCDFPKPLLQLKSSIAALRLNVVSDFKKFGNNNTSSPFGKAAGSMNSYCTLFT